MNANPKIGILLLAAGKSSRLGQTKQLLDYKGRKLIQHTLSICLESKIGPVMVVTGAFYQKVESAIKDFDCQVIRNEHWQKGMGSSVSAGVRSVIEDGLDAVVLVLVDQIHLQAKHLHQLKDKFVKDASSIILSQYDDGQGPPSLFASQHFDALAVLDGEAGAKPIVKKNKDKVAYIDFPQGHIDIDRPEDLDRLLTSQTNKNGT